MQKSHTNYNRRHWKIKRLFALFIISSIVFTAAMSYSASVRFITLTEQTMIPEEDTIHIVVPEDSAVAAVGLSADEETMLLKIGMSEAGVESVECIACVMLTVLNRVKDTTFPNDIYEVLHQTNQFTPVLYGTYDTAIPNEKCYEALELVESGWDQSGGALYFEDCENADNWHSRNFTLLFKLGNMRFYR